MRKAGIIAAVVVVAGLLVLAVPSGPTTLAAAVEGYIGGLGVSGTSYEVVRQTESEAEVIVYLEITEDGQTQRVPKENLLLRKDSNGNWGIAQATAIIIPPEILAAVNLTTPRGGNPAAGDNVLVIRHEYGLTIDDAWMTDSGSNYLSVNMQLRINGEEVSPLVVRATANGTAVDLPQGSAQDFVAGDEIEIELETPLQSSDLIQLVWVPEDLMLFEYLVQ